LFDGANFTSSKKLSDEVMMGSLFFQVQKIKDFSLGLSKSKKWRKLSALQDFQRYSHLGFEASLQPERRLSDEFSRREKEIGLSLRQIHIVKKFCLIQLQRTRGHGRAHTLTSKVRRGRR